jgi:hypothetical protein
VLSRGDRKVSPPGPRMRRFLSLLGLLEGWELGLWRLLEAGVGSVVFDGAPPLLDTRLRFGDCVEKVLFCLLVVGRSDNDAADALGVLFVRGGVDIETVGAVKPDDGADGFVLGVAKLCVGTGPMSRLRGFEADSSGGVRTLVPVIAERGGIVVDVGGLAVWPPR